MLSHKNQTRSRAFYLKYIFFTKRSMRVSNISILLFTSISVTLSVASAHDHDVKQPVEFRVLRGGKHSKRSKSRGGKKGGVPAHAGSEITNMIKVGLSVRGDVPDDGCPETSPAFSEADVYCGVEGKVCNFTNETTFPGGSATTTDECTCNNGKWDCSSMAASGISMTACPIESPMVTNETMCSEDALHPTPCMFEYDSTLPGAVCTTTDECTCTNGTWDCEVSIFCVDADPPWLISCPAESPLLKNETTCDADHQVSPCSFEYDTNSTEGICTSQDECSCNNGSWECTSSIGCVSADPPVVAGGMAP